MARQQMVFIGGGNMARSLVGGLVADGYPADRIRVCDPVEEQRSTLQARFGVATGDNNNAAVADADVVVLAVKPQTMQAVASDLAPSLAVRRPLVVSVAAGIREEALARWLGYDGPIVRCMPNTPALIQAGVNVLYPNHHVTSAQRSMAETILAAAGMVVWIDDEAMMDAVTAISGSGPAYYFLFMESMEAAAIEHGLPAGIARALVLGTALGAARMAAESEDDPGTLRENVTSKGGTTAAALAAFEAGGLREIVARAVAAARDRSVELGDEMGSGK